MHNDATNRPGRGILTGELKRRPESRDMNTVLTIAEKDLESTLTKIFGRHVRPEHRAAQDLKDFIQKTLLELHRAMSSGQAVFLTREDLRHWTAQCARWLAIKIYNKASRGDA